MDRQEYLAKHYLNADAPASTSLKKKHKKRKLNHEQEPTSLTIIDDHDENSIASHQGQSDDEDGPQVFGGFGFNAAQRKPRVRRLGEENWVERDQKEADKIVAQAERERREREAAEDDTPVIAEGEDEARMNSGAKAGLQSAKQVSADMKKKAEEERRRMEDSGDYASGKGGQTIYRDATGRVVNLAAARAEAQKKERDEAKKKMEQKSALLGDVQRKQKEDRMDELSDARTLTLARGKDDEAMNEELRNTERWADPMKGLLTEKREIQEIKSGGKVKRKRTYQGPSEPNRYGILPGYRWDGVDRGNGFERKWFAARNEKQGRQQLEYMWEMDDFNA